MLSDIINAAASGASTAAPLVGLAVFKKVSEEVGKDLYFYIKSIGMSAARGADRKAFLVRFNSQIKDIRTVRTILYPERSVDLSLFYSPCRIRVGDDSVVVSQLDEISDENSFVIEGTVGQGKTTFLRYVASNEFFLNKKIPIFVELRKIGSGCGLNDLIVKELCALGLVVDLAGSFDLINNGMFNLYLDAFDEVRDAFRDELVSDIEYLHRRATLLKIVVSTRPDTWCSRFMKCYCIAPLRGVDYREVVRRMVGDEGVSVAINDGIKNESSSLRKLLRTPLMVALLVVRYRIENSLPKSEHSFYENLMLLLLERHDKAKGGFRRERRSGASDDDLRQFFNALSYVTRKSNEMSFSRLRLIDYAKQAILATSLKYDVDKLIDDVIRVTCLIVSEGGEDRFIHKGVQEFYSALFINSRPQELVLKFYNSMLIDCRRWRPELEFLRRMDSYRFNRYFMLPSVDAFVLDAGDVLKDRARALVLAKHLSVGFSVAFVVGRVSGAIEAYMHSVSFVNSVNYAAYRVCVEDGGLFDRCFSDLYVDASLFVDFSEDTFEWLGLSCVLDYDQNDDCAVRFANYVYRKVRSAGVYCRSVVDSAGSADGLFDF